MNEETKMTLGIAIKGLTLIITVAFGYFTLQSQVEAHNAAQDGRITALETTANNAKLAEIPATLSRIEEKIDRIDGEKRK